MRFFDKYTGYWRRWKLLYVLYNLSQLKHLGKQRRLLRQKGIKRPVFFPLHSKHFKHLPKQQENFDDTDWGKDGYIILRSVLSEQEVDQINDQVQTGLESGELAFNYTKRKILFAYEKVPQLKQIMTHPDIIKALQENAKDDVVPFQSINFHYGSQQKAHSDSIHMSTYPEGGLIAAWIALDDTDDENGSVFYYPGSHKLPYVTNELIGASTSWMLSPNPNKLYEQYIDKLVAENDLKKEIFHAKKGDVLIWHANLLHGGLPHNNMGRTRRSLVVHYFKKDVICYHEISQRPAIIKSL